MKKIEKYKKVSSVICAFGMDGIWYKIMPMIDMNAEGFAFQYWQYCIANTGYSF